MNRSNISHSTLSQSLLSSWIGGSIKTSWSTTTTSTASWRQFLQTLGASQSKMQKLVSNYQSQNKTTSAIRSTSQMSRSLSRLLARPYTMYSEILVLCLRAQSASSCWVSAQVKAFLYPIVWSRSSTRPRSRVMGKMAQITRIWEHWTLNWSANLLRGCLSK